MEPAPPTQKWSSASPGVVSTWNEEEAQRLAEAGCTGGSTPLVVESDGRYYPSCSSTGVVFAPPLSGAALAELLFPDEWGIVPPT